MKLKLISLLLLFIFPTLLFAQRDSRLNKENAKNQITDVEDYATSVITINQLGQTVTNIGQFYPFGGVLPTGRWPIGTDHDQIYKMNFMLGIPNNVASTRASNTEDFDPIPGYNNPDSGLVAISTNPNSWPKDQNGNPYWPVRTEDGQDSIVSQEDTYAVFDDETNARAIEDPSKLIGIEVHQSTYAWSTSKDQDYIFIKYEMINKSGQQRDSIYFGMYCDFDAGGVSNDYEDDYWRFEKDREFFYIEDADGISQDWRGSDPFLLGLVFLETPEVDGQQLGLTDWHYSNDGDSPWADIAEEEQIFYEWMSSSERLRNDPNWPNLFHGDDLHYDDPSLIDPAGERLDAIAASGPYTLLPNEKMTFVCALVAGADYEHISRNVDRIYEVYENGIQIVPPPKPDINTYAFDNMVRLTWSNEKEFDYTDLNGETLVKEYRVYKTTDPQRNEWGDPVAVIPVDTTLTEITQDAYIWEDNDVQDYFYYSYSVTTLDKDSLESGRAFLPSDQTSFENTAELRPVDSPRASLEDVKVVPNPYIISATWERKRLGDPLLGEPIRDLAFINLPDKCTIQIFTLDGDLVKTLEHNGTSGTAFWDIRSDYNQLVSTGVYFYHIDSQYGEKIGKFAIVR